MTVNKNTGASPTKRKHPWEDLPWSKMKAGVFRLQVRIAKAEKEGKTGKVKALQRLLTSSFYAKCLAVKRVTSNVGGKTIDNAETAGLRIIQPYASLSRVQ